MASTYNIALTIMRTFAGINLVGGVTALIAVVPVAMTGVFLGGDAKSVSISLLIYLLEWGFTATIAGFSLLLLAKPVARFAAKP
ncbi:MAG TPA: hypothetical protein VGH02_10915 [Rhizomicrobium sp.]|jgi:hypothetical protein